MKSKAEKIMKKLEDQLAQTIMYLGAIDGISKLYRDCADIRQDVFLFDTVYGALWDAIFVRVGAIWDRTNGVSSLPKLAIELKKIPDLLDRRVISEIESQQSAEMLIIQQWRHNVIAHTRLSLDEIEFDKSNSINVEKVRLELERIERILSLASASIGRPPLYFGALKMDAVRNAQHTLGKIKP